jgi:hypothetical protein
MEIEITLKNYRCFPDTNPAKIVLRDGFTALIGVNNAGKSSLLKFFYEFRSLFQSWTPNSQILLNTFQGQAQTFGIPATVFDQAELFSNTNTRDLQIEIKLPRANELNPREGCPVASQVLITVMRPTNTWTAKVTIPNFNLPTPNLTFGGMGTILIANRRALTDLSELFEAFKEIADSLYVGPFRNAVNVGSNDNYFDIQVGQGFITSWTISRSKTKRVINSQKT